MDPDDRIRAVTTALAERDHLTRVRALLKQDIANEEKRVEQLALELRHERADVERMTTGVMGFLNELITPAAVLAEEQRQVVQAQARLVEAQGGLQQLRKQLAEIEAKLHDLSRQQLDVELAAARAAKEEMLLRSGTSTAAELQDIAIRIESIDIELVPLADAVAAGNGAFEALRHLLALLDGAASVDTKQAKALAGEAQAKVVHFARALSDVATADFSSPLEVAPADLAFADAWTQLLTARRSPQERAQSARADMVARIERIAALLAPLRARHGDLAARRLQLVSAKQQLVG